MRRAGQLALAIGLALAQRVWAGDAFEAVLVGSNEVPGPGMNEGSFAAAVSLEGTKVALTLTPKDVGGRLSAHLHRGAAGVVGRLVAEFPWDSLDTRPLTFIGSVSARVAADLAAYPDHYYVDVHTEAFPAGAARGQLARRANAEMPATAAAPDDGAALVRSPSIPIPPEGPRTTSDPPRSRGGRVEKKEQRIVGAVPEFKTYLDPDFPLDVATTAGLEIVFFASGDCDVEGSTVHISGAGTCTLEAHQPGDPYYLAAPIVDLEFPIEKADQTIDFPDPGGPFDGEYDVPLAASASSGLPVAFDASYPCTMVGSSLRAFASGVCSVTAFQPGDRNFNPSPSVTRSIEVVVPPPPS